MLDFKSFSFPFFLYLFPHCVPIDCSAALAAPKDFLKGRFRFVTVGIGDNRVGEARHGECKRGVLMTVAKAPLRTLHSVLLLAGFQR